MSSTTVNCWTDANRHSHNKTLRKAPAPWWDNECNKLIKSKSSFFKEYKAHPNILQRYIEAGKHANKIFFTKKKRDRFKQHCSFHLNTPITKVWSHIHAFTKSRQEKSSHIILSENQFFAAFEKLASRNPIPPQELEDIINMLFEGNDLDSVFMLHSFSQAEYAAAISSLKLRAATGPDLISNKIIKLFPAELHSLILKIFNLMFHKSIFPKK